jgi:hypothetical protein
MQAYVIQIGNSDNKLTQNRWAHFIAGVDLAIRNRCTHIHLLGLRADIHSVCPCANGRPGP